MAALTLQRLQPLRLKPIDLQLTAGELVFISGPSGAGKSLLLRAIADLDLSTGEVLLDAQPRSAIAGPEWRRRVGLLPAESGWWADRVGAHFDAPPTGEASISTASGCFEPLAQLGFEPDVLDWDILRLSTGERQRLALARLIANRPEVLLLDEATANLDPANRERAEQLIDAYRRSHQAAVLWASHDPDQRQRLAQAATARCFVIEHGRLQPERSQSWT